MTRRSYARLTKSQWDEAAEQNSRGASYDDIAKTLGVSVRAVATHLPPALERRRAAIAASATGSAATCPVPSISIAAIPDVADREAATKHWRQTAWADTQALQARLRQELTNPAPDAKAIRALGAGAEALKHLIAIGRNVLDVDKAAADVELPELIVRELTLVEVSEIRRKQLEETGDIDPADLLAMREAIGTDEEAPSEIVEEGDDEPTTA